MLATVAVLGVAIGVGATGIEIAVLLLAIGLVLVSEACNSALEAVVDLASPAIHPLAKIAKDVIDQPVEVVDRIKKILAQ